MINKYVIVVGALSIAFMLGFASNMGGNNTQFIPIVSAGGTDDHGELDGLGDDDHTQYLLHTELDSEAELEAELLDVGDVFTDSDTEFIIESFLDCINAPTDEYVLTYESSTGRFEWEADETGGAGDGYAGDMGHPHEQDLNESDTPSFGGVFLTNFLTHEGDLDTEISLNTDEFIFSAGGVQFIKIDETTQDIIIFNDVSADIDFRVESNGDANMIFVDGGSNEVGIGTGTPGYTLDVDGNIGNDADLYLGDDIYLKSSSADIKHDTSDGSDNEATTVCGGGGATYTRGAYIQMYGNEALGNGDMILRSGDDDIEFYAGATKVMTVENSNNHLGIYSETSPFFAVECINQNSADGKMRAYAFPTYSDMRAKTKVIENLPEKYVKRFCENVSQHGIMIYALHDNGQYEDGTIWIDENANYSNIDIGIGAQLLFNWLNNTDLFGIYAEKLAHTIVYKPEDETKDLWSVDYESVTLIYCKYTEFLNEDILQLREDATEEIAKNRFHIKALENWAEQFGYTPPPWN